MKQPLKRRFLLSFLMLAFTAGFCLSAEVATPVSLAKELADRIKEAETNQDPAVLLLQLRACIENAQKASAPSDQNPFHTLWISCLSPERSSQVRNAALKAVLNAGLAEKSYTQGIDLLVRSYLGDKDHGFRMALRQGLFDIVRRNKEKYVPWLKEAISHGASSPKTIEDAAYMLWDLDAPGTVDALMAGLAKTQSLQEDVAVFHRLLSDYLLHREVSLDKWRAYWDAHKGKDLVALKENHFIRTRLTEELVGLFKSAAKSLEKNMDTETGAAAFWHFLKKGMTADRPALRENACVALRLLARTLMANSKLTNAQALIKEQVQTLKMLLGTGGKPSHEPFAVKRQVLRTLLIYGDKAASDPELSKFLADVLAVRHGEAVFQQDALQLAGELNMTALRSAVGEVILGFEGPIAPEFAGVFVEAVKTMGRLGFDAAASTDRADRIVLNVISHFNEFLGRNSPNRGEHCQQIVKSLGKLGGRCAEPVKQKIHGLLKTLVTDHIEKEPTLVFFAINAWGYIGDARVIDDLSVILTRKTDYPPNHVRAAVDALWRIGSYRQNGTFEKVIQVLVVHLESGDAKLDEAIQQKIVFLCRANMAGLTVLAHALTGHNKLPSAVALLSADDIKSLRRKAFTAGTEQDLAQLWDVEMKLLKALETLEQFKTLHAGIGALKNSLTDSKRGPLFQKVSKGDVKILDVWAARVQKQETFAGHLKAGALDPAFTQLKNWLGADKTVMLWALEKVRQSQLAAAVTEKLLKDADAMKSPEVAAWVKKNQAEKSD